MFFWNSLAFPMIQQMLAILSTTKNQIANVYWTVTEKALATHSSTLACKNPMDGGAWAAVHGVAKSQTRLSDFTFTSHFHALEKEMATHSSVLAWRIPGTEKPGRLPYGVIQSRTQLTRLRSSRSIGFSYLYRYK